MIYAGIDVGKKVCKMAILGEELIYVGNYDKEKLKGVFAAGIDAPLSLPPRGTLRECERKLLNLGIRLFPSGAPFFREIALIGMAIAEELRALGIRVFEVYPYATRVIMGIAPKAKKRSKNGLEKLRLAVSQFFTIPELSHDEIDAVLSAMTVKEFIEGRGLVLDGDGEIVVPRKRFNTSERWRRDE
ncbi:MAG: DUF429 domain-containing protein [Archaeoglobaceae archaeon]